MKPVVRINDTALDSPGFAHVLATGTRSPRTTFVVSNDIDKKLAAYENPVGLVIKAGPVPAEGGAEPEQETFSNLYLRSRRRLDPWNVEWSLEDQRSQFEDVRVSCFFNLVRPTSSVAVTDARGPGLTRFNPSAFRPHTLRAEGENDFFTPDTEDADKKSAVPWTALQAVQWLLSKGLAFHAAKRGLAAKISFRVKVADNGFVLQNFVSDERRFPDVLADLLASASAVLWQDKYGVWVVDDPFAAPYKGSPRLGGYEGAGWLEPADMTRTAPKRMNVSFPAVYEVLLSAEEGNSTEAPGFNTAAIRLENVLQLPDDVGGRKRGEWVLVSEALSLWNNEGWPNGETLTLAKLRRGVLGRGQQLGRFINLGDAVDLSAKYAARVVEVVGSYRRVFRISPLLMPFVRDWEPSRSAFADPVTGLRVVSPVWQDYCVVSQGKVTNGGRPQAFLAHNVTHPDTDAALTASAQAPAFVVPRDKAQGVFEIKFSDMQSLNLVSFIPSRVVTTNGGSVQFAAAQLASGDNLAVFDFCSYVDDWKISVILSMTFTAPNSSKNAVTFTKDLASLLPDSAKPTGPDCYDLYVPDVQARHEWIPGTTTIDAEAGGFVILDTPLRNLNHLEATADAYIARAVPSFQNRVMGLFTAPDYDPERDQLGGPKTEIALRLLPDGTYETRHVFPFQVPAPDIIAMLSPAVRKAEYGRLA